MDGIAVKPRHAQIMVNVIALGVVSGLCLAVPALGLLCAMLAPLFSCPLVRHREEWLSWAASAVPAACWLIAGYDPAVGAALLLPSLLPLIATHALGHLQESAHELSGIRLGKSIHGGHMELGDSSTGKRRGGLLRCRRNR